MKDKVNDKAIVSIDELLIVLEEIIDEYSDKDTRRKIIRIIEFAERQKALGRSLVDVIWWIEKELRND